MFDKMDMALLDIQARGRRVFERLIHEEDGASNFIEIGVIIVILVAVAVIFQDGLKNAIQAAFQKLTDFINA